MSIHKHGKSEKEKLSHSFVQLENVFSWVCCSYFSYNFYSAEKILLYANKISQSSCYTSNEGVKS